MHSLQIYGCAMYACGMLACGMYECARVFHECLCMNNLRVCVCGEHACMWRLCSLCARTVMHVLHPSMLECVRHVDGVCESRACVCLHTV